MTSATFYENKTIPVATYIGQGLTIGPHLHNHVEIIYLLSGEGFAVADEKRAPMKAGDIFVAFPNQIHYYPSDVAEDKRKNILLIFSPFVCHEFKDLFLRMTPVSPVVPAERLDPDVPTLVKQIYECQNSDTPYKEAITRGYLIVLLSKLFASMEFRDEKKTDGYLLKSILNYCNKNYKESLSLAKVANDLSIGKYYISRTLSDKLKISFTDYVNGLRINDATRRLIDDPEIPITDIAYDCGFASTRTFNRAFLKYTGMKPREYREANRYKSIAPINFYIRSDVN